jgi:hypothetical protein
MPWTVASDATAAWVLGIGAEHLVLGILGQARPSGDMTRLLLMLVVLTAVGVLIDGRTTACRRDAVRPAAAGCGRAGDLRGWMMAA